MIAAVFQPHFQLSIWNRMTFFILQSKASTQFSFVVGKKLDVKELVRHNDFAVFLIIDIQQIKVAAIASPCLRETGGVGGVRDEVINMPAYIDAGFATAVENKQIILRRQHFILENILARL